jgi:hypothetical protein
MQTVEVTAACALPSPSVQSAPPRSRNTSTPCNNFLSFRISLSYLHSLSEFYEINTTAVYSIAGNFLGLPVGHHRHGRAWQGGPPPIGLQFIGRPWSEATLLHIAFAMQASGKHWTFFVSAVIISVTQHCWRNRSPDELRWCRRRAQRATGNRLQIIFFPLRPPEERLMISKAT